MLSRTLLVSVVLICVACGTEYRPPTRPPKPPPVDSTPAVKPDTGEREHEDHDKKADSTKGKHRGKRDHKDKGNQQEGQH